MDEIIDSHLKKAFACSLVGHQLMNEIYLVKVESGIYNRDFIRFQSQNLRQNKQKIQCLPLPYINCHTCLGNKRTDT